MYDLLMADLVQDMRDHVVQIKADLKEGRKNSQVTIFHDVLTNENVRPEEKETAHLAVEAQLLVGAGTITTAHTLCTITFYLLDNPKIVERLQQELITLKDPKWQQLEMLPYMAGIIQHILYAAY